MFRKLFIRLFLLCVGISGVAVLALGVMGYLAFREPGYYAELRSQHFTNTDELALEATLKLMERDLSHWSRTSLQRQQNSAIAPGAALIGGKANYDPKQDVKSVSLTQDQLNTLLASSTGSKSGDWRNPRIRLGDDRIDFAFEVVAPKFRLILSAELKPSLMADGRVRFDLLAARIGRLTLPVQTVLDLLPLEPSYRENNLELKLTGPTPHVCLTLPDADKAPAKLKSIRCAEGKITVELLPPILQPKLGAPADELAELFTRD